MKSRPFIGGLVLVLAKKGGAPTPPGSRFSARLPQGILGPGARNVGGEGGASTPFSVSSVTHCATSPKRKVPTSN